MSCEHSTVTVLKVFSYFYFTADFQQVLSAKPEDKKKGHLSGKHPMKLKKWYHPLLFNCNSFKTFHSFILILPLINFF